MGSSEWTVARGRRSDKMSQAAHRGKDRIFASRESVVWM